MTLKHKELSEKFKSQSEALYERAVILESKHVPPAKAIQHKNTIERLRQKADIAKSKSELYLTKKDNIRYSDEDAVKRLEEKISELHKKRLRCVGREKIVISKQISYNRSRLNMILLNQEFDGKELEIRGIKIKIENNRIKIYHPSHVFDRDRRIVFIAGLFSYSVVHNCWMRKLSRKGIEDAKEVCQMDILQTG